MIKKLLCFVFGCAVAGMAMGQTQRGYVRTIGRSGQPGKAVPSVIIKASGLSASVVSAADGHFELPFSGLKNGSAYRFESVKKSGYDLCDPYTIGRNYGLSTTVPVEIVMVNRAQKEAEKAAMAEKFQAQAMAAYNKKLAELEARNLTIQRKYEESLELENMLQKILDQIDEQTEYYATRDYDRMDSLDQVITHHIEQGEFDEAESLIKSKGSIEERLREVQEKKMKARDAQDVAAQTQAWAVAMTQDAEQMVSSLEQDLMNLFQIARNQNRNDTAYYFIKQLVKLDPNNVDYLNKAGCACELKILCQDLNYVLFGDQVDSTLRNQALEYFHRALDIQHALCMEEDADIASTYYNIAIYYDHESELDSALVYYQKSLSLRLKFLGEEHPDVVAIYNKVGEVYVKKRQYPQALAYLQKVMAIYEKRYGIDSVDLRTYLSLIYCYVNTGEYDKALFYLENFQGTIFYEVSLNLKGEVLYMKGDYEGSYQVWLEIQHRNPNYPQRDWARKAEEMHQKAEKMER